MKITTVTSNKGAVKLVVDGYCYRKEKVKNSIYYWKCENNLICKSRISTKIEDQKHKILNYNKKEHTHEPLAHKIEVYKTNAEVKNMAKTTHHPPSQIVNQSIRLCPETCRAYLPKATAQKKKIARARKTGGQTVEPASLEEINIPQEFQFVEGEKFVLVEKSFAEEKIIILGTIQNLKIMSKSKLWLMDGTFQVVPNIMRQLFSIHCKVGDGIIVPVLYVLMSSKTKQCYEEVFYEICQLACHNNVNLYPKYIISDFEKASVNAAKAFFPSACFKGCFFHFGKIIWRRIQTEGFASAYGNNETFSIQMRMLKSLAYLKYDQVKEYFEEIKKIIPKKYSKMIEWFEKNYVYGNTRKRTHNNIN